MITKWLEKRRLAKTKKEETVKKYMEEQRSKVQMRVDLLERVMTSHPCPVREGEDNCAKVCVHFKYGYVARAPLALNNYPYLPNSKPYRAIPPRCRLWGLKR